jgi:hypothetical protein
VTIRRVLLIVAAAALLIFGVVTYLDARWWSWHGDQQAIDQAVDRALDEPGGGDFAKAADVIRASSRPLAIKRFQIGRLAVSAFAYDASRRPPESAEQGLKMMEAFAASDDRDARSGVQQLRMIFQRGWPDEVNRFPTDQAVAECWYRIERREAEDPARCIALRRQRLPRIG